MPQSRAIKIILIIVGVLFVATIYPLAMSLLKFGPAQTEPMMLSLYVTLGIFLLLASRNPAANLSLIAFAAWSSLAHAAVMTVQSFSDAGERTHLVFGTILFALIGAALLALLPKLRMGQP